MTGHRVGALAALGLLVVAACGGGGPATQVPAGTQAGGGGGGGGTAATTDPGVTTAPATTPAPVATQSGGGGGGGGGSPAAKACELLSVEEAATTLGTGALTATDGELAGQLFCDYRTASGEAVLTSYYQPVGAAALWSVFESSLTTDPVSGLGDKAMFEPSTKLLFVLKGDAFFNVFVAEVGLTPEQALEQERKLATVMVGRL